MKTLPHRIHRHRPLAGLIATLLGGLLLAPPAAQAATVNVAFSLTSNSGSGDFYALGTVGHGHFSFDDSLMPEGGTGQVGNVISGLPTLALAFSWFGAEFSVANARIATLSFTDGVLTDWMLGGTYLPPICGFSRLSCVHGAGLEPDFSLVASIGGSMNDGLHTGIGSGHGTLVWSLEPTLPVPEPGSSALLALGLLGLGWRRWQAAAADRRQRA